MEHVKSMENSAKRDRNQYLALGPTWTPNNVIYSESIKVMARLLNSRNLVSEVDNRRHGVILGV